MVSTKLALVSWGHFSEKQINSREAGLAVNLEMCHTCSRVMKRESHLDRAC